MEVARGFKEAGFHILSTKHTCQLLNESGVEAELINKLGEGRPDILDAIMNEKIDLMVNTPVDATSKQDDSYLRKGAIKKKIPYITTIAAAKATVSGLKSMHKPGCGVVKSLQELHSEITEK